jgi:hypothetical protein
MSNRLKPVLLMLTLSSIVLKDRPDHQTVSFVNRVNAWMKQWTIANNFDEYFVEPGNSYIAVQAWREKFLQSFRSAVGELEPKDGSLEKNFQFIWYEQDVHPNRPKGGHATASIDMNLIEAMGPEEVSQ